MVRFKEVDFAPLFAIDFRFHPTMVRFKAAHPTAHRDCKHVSIPLWCDLKQAGKNAEKPAPPCFHPTMVGFKDSRQVRKHEVNRSFHPTMVRFKGDSL